MSKQALLEKLAMLVGCAVLVAATWFWWEQIGQVLETLELAYGE